MATRTKPVRLVVMLSEQQAAHLEATSSRLDEPKARIVRLALDAFLAQADRKETRRSAEALDR